VAEYDVDVAKRVQRLFDGIKPGRPMWRFNVLEYVRPDLFQPRSETDPREAVMRITAMAHIFALSIKPWCACRALARCYLQFIRI